MITTREETGLVTLVELAEYIKRQESYFAYGGETIVLGWFVQQYDYVERIIDGDSTLDADQLVDMQPWIEAYNEEDELL